MYFGKNLQYLRKINGTMSQEKLAERMGVSRQAVSKWEADEAYPEMEKLFELCSLFSCSMDQLLRTDLCGNSDVYSPVRMETVERFRMARYVIISPMPEDDAISHMKQWAADSGLMDVPRYELNMIGWDFPFLSLEQKTVYGMRGYVSACIIPGDFEPKCPYGAELAWQETARYAAITIKEPFSAAFDLIPNGYKRIMEHLDQNSIKGKMGGENISCFERVYEKDGVCYMDVYISVEAMAQSKESVTIL